MSIDFDSAALQTQHEEEEYDQEDYAREQELHKLLTDLPDDMLEDSRDSSPELEYSTCSNKKHSNSPQSAWREQWADRPQTISHEQNYAGDYNQHFHEEYNYKDGAAHINGHLQSQPLPQAWNKDHQFTQGDYTYSSIVTEKSTELNDLSTEGYESQPHPQGTNNHVEYNGGGGLGIKQTYGDPTARNHLQNLDSGAGEGGVNVYKVSYNPHHPAYHQKMIDTQEGQFDDLQREFLDSTQKTADREQVAQLQILNKAQQRQIEHLEHQVEDSKRKMRYLEHQFAIVKDEKDGLAVSLKESSQLVKEAKDRDVQMQNKLREMEQQVQVLTDRDKENTKKQRIAEAAVDSMKQQMLELCRSDTLSKAREQHDRDLAVMKEQHETALLALQQKLDSTTQALNEQIDVGQRFQEKMKMLEHQREEELLERARIVNALTQRLEESQQQCAKLLQTNSVQEMSQMQIKLQQAQSAKALSENMNKVLQDDLADLKEQITLYESAVKHGVIALDLTTDWENQLSESCMDLGLKKTNRKNGILQSSAALAHLSDSKLPKDEALRMLQVEMQRCLTSLKAKRQKISQLQEELQHCQSQVNELQTQLDEAKLSSLVKETNQVKHLDMTGESKKEVKRLQDDNQQLQQQVELLEKKNKELKQSEEKVKAANSELCTKMREMIQELDQEKQEAAQRTERIHQQYRNDVVNRVKAELMQEHNAQVEELTLEHQQHIQQLQTQLSEANDKMLAVQECYISVCKEKDLLEERLSKREKEDALTRENEQKMREESITAMEKLRAELEDQHQATVNQLKALWLKEKEAELQQQVNSHVASAKATWKEDLLKMEIKWTQQLEEARREKHTETAEATCQTDEIMGFLTITGEELDSRLSAQKQQLRLEADKITCKAVEEARKEVQQELHEKHLELMAEQVEGAVTRAYNRWIEDLTSLPEYQTALQSEKEKWEELHKKITQQQVSQALLEAEEQWQKRHKNQLEKQSSGALGQMEELQKAVATLHNQLEQVRREQAALLKAELAAARAAWNRDKQQEISIIQVRSEQVYQTNLQEQHKKMEQTKELLIQMEAQHQQTIKAREEEWRCQYAEKELALKQRVKDELMTELQTEMAVVQEQLLRDTKTDQQGTEDTQRTSGTSSEVTITHIIQSSCREMVTRAITQAKNEWKQISEERLRRVLKETHEQHEKQINKLQSCLSQKEQAHCKNNCSETLSRLQKKNHELQKNLHKACRQLQHSVREHKTAMQNLKDEHGSNLQKVKEEHLQQLEEVKRARESTGVPDHQQNLQQGLEEMKQQYLQTVEKIRGDMLRYLQESRERAAEMIRFEVQRERQDTARKMRRYYLTCLQELLEDGGKSTGAEKKIMSAASKLASMAKVLETPIKSKSGKNYSLPNCPTATSTTACLPGFSRQLPALKNLSDVKPEQSSDREKAVADGKQKADRTKPLSPPDTSAAWTVKATADAGTKPQTAAHTPFPSHKPPQQVACPSQVDVFSFSVRGKSREMYLQGQDPDVAVKCLDTEEQANKFSFGQEGPVRDVKLTDWSLTSSDSDTSFQVPRLSYSGRKVEPVKPFSMSATSNSDLGNFGVLTPDMSDLTVYNEIAKQTPLTQTLDLPSVKMSGHREPTPGSEGEKKQGVCSRPLFSELRQRQQDSGFDSPFYHHK